MEQITIKLDQDKAEQISIVLYNLFIKDFFDFSQAIDENYMSFDELLKLCNLMIDLKACIDESLDKTY